MRFLCIALALSASPSAFAVEPNVERGAELFRRGCAVCHSLAPDESMTGPSLSGVWHRRAGTLASFPRYSPALKSAGVTWDDTTLDAWLADPQALVPGNRMTFPGIDDAETRADLLAFLRDTAAPGAERGGGAMGGMMGMGADDPNLQDVSPDSLVTAITYCGDTYDVKTADGATIQFWERNLRFKTDSSGDGPKPGAPAIVGAGMMGDRASVIFAAPEELGQFIERSCAD